MGLVRVAARTAVISGTATAVSGRVAQRQMAAAQAQSPAQAAPATAGDESIAKVQELAALHAQGILSDEEFAAAKAKALGI